ELTYPFIIYDFDKDLLKTFDENNSIKEQMKNSSSFLFPVITNNNTLLDYQVNIANGVVEYFQPADLPTDLGQDNVQIKSLSTTIYTILEYNQLKKEDCYLVQMPYGPFVLFTNIDGEEFSIPLELALTNFNNVSKASTDEIKKRLLKMKELFADPQTFTPTSENAPAFNVFKITDVWYGLYEEIINTFQESK
ncbi:MAG: hypothetical protein U9N81_11040, partial [Bacillota bacterium]|nr:hypothetical protein [Bacillota bacterium]